MAARQDVRIIGGPGIPSAGKVTARVAVLVVPSLLALAVLPGCRALWGSPTVVSGGPVGAVRTEDGAGAGWALSVGTEIPEAGTIFQLSYVRTEYDDQEFSRLAGEMVALMTGADRSGTTVQLGWGAHWTHEGAWGTGPSAGIGLYHRPSKNLGFLLLASGYGWLGSRDDEFDAGVEALLSAQLSLSF